MHSCQLVGSTIGPGYTFNERKKSTGQNNLAFSWDKCCHLSMCLTILIGAYLARYAPRGTVWFYLFKIISRDLVKDVCEIKESREGMEKEETHHPAAFQLLNSLLRGMCFTAVIQLVLPGLLAAVSSRHVTCWASDGRSFWWKYLRMIYLKKLHLKIGEHLPLTFETNNGLNASYMFNVHVPLQDDRTSTLNDLKRKNLLPGPWF